MAKKTKVEKPVIENPLLNALKDYDFDEFINVNWDGNEAVKQIFADVILKWEVHKQLIATPKTNSFIKQPERNFRMFGYNKGANDRGVTKNGPWRFSDCYYLKLYDNGKCFRVYEDGHEEERSSVSDIKSMVDGGTWIELKTQVGPLEWTP